MPVAIISLDFSGLEAGFAFAGILFVLLILSGTALISGFIWGRLAPSNRLGPRNVFRIALVGSLLLFVLTLFMCAHAAVSGFYRGPLGFFSMAFWPFTSGIVAFLALRRLRRFKRTPNNLNAEHVVRGNGG